MSAEEQKDIPQEEKKESLAKEEETNANQSNDDTKETEIDTKEEIVADSEASQEEEEEPLSDALDEYKILTIDDDKWIQRIFTQYLNLWGFKHLVAMDAVSGLNLAVKEKPLIIFLDIVLPEITGDLALQFFKGLEDTKDIPVVIISANLSKELLRITHKNGASGFISKPFNQEILFEKVREYLDPGIFNRMVADGKINPNMAKKKVHLFGH